MPIHFTNPYYLLLLPLLAYFWWLGRRSLADLSPFRRRLSLGLRLAVALSLLLALAGIQTVRPSRSVAVMFVLDASDSVPEPRKREALDYIRRASARMRPGDTAGLVVFGSDAFIEAMPTARLKLSKIYSAPGRSYTDIAAAIRLADAALPPGVNHKIVLLSDGNENLGNALQAATLARAGRTEIDTVPLGAAYTHEALLDKLALPPEAKIGEPVELKVVAESLTAQPALLRLFRSGRYLGSQKVQLAPGKNVFTYPATLEKPGFYTYEAHLEAAEDTVPENNRASGFVLVKGRPKVLYVCTDARSGLPLARALRSQQIDVQVRDASMLPTRATDLADCDSLILDNVSALYVSPSQMEMIAGAVKDTGMGFGMIGGAESFGIGGYYRTPIEEALPVDVDVRKMKHFPSVALCLVIDKSGSMAESGMGYAKVDLAKEAAIAAASLLADQDQVGVLCFDEATQWVAEMQRVTDKRKIEDRVGSIVAGGGTSMYPAMIEAANALARADTRIKHAIFLTDGMSLPADFNHAVRTLRKAGVTASTVGVGTDTDAPFLREIARLCGGRFYYTDNPAQLPRIFTKEALLASRSQIVEEPFQPRVNSESPMLKGLPLDTMPPLLGYVATTAKPLAETALTSHKDDPILAAWRYGLGKSFAFTSDARPRWAAHWLAWPAFSRFWAQTVRWSLRQSSATTLQTTIEIARGKAQVTVDALDAQGRFLNFLDVRARVTAPQGQSLSLPLEQQGPGRYGGEFEARDPGSYLVTVSHKGPGGRVSAQIGGVAIPYPEEYRALRENRPLLERIAEASGGQPSAGAEGIFGGPRKSVQSRLDVWPYLLLLAFLLFPFDAAVRRVAMDWEAAAETLGAARHRILGKLRLRRARQTASEGETGATGRLLRRKRQARADNAPEDPTVIVASPEPPKPRPQKPEEKAPPETSPKATASRLLERKKKRQVGKDK
ncbi:MAG: VWA domain-containing protein [Armatimonadetes bacterium]|nr:VWA domain-containing protein [Armatimonadota bacterium]